MEPAIIARIAVGNHAHRDGTPFIYNIMLKEEAVFCSVAVESTTDALAAYLDTT